MDIIELLHTARQHNASDVHLNAGNVPIFRIHGLLERYEDISPITQEEMKQALHRVTKEQERETFNRTSELDFAYSIEGEGRFRFNVAMQRNSIAMVIRLLPMETPQIDKMGLPDVCRDLITRPRGMIIISGPTGSGKSTTLAAMIDYLNKTEKRRVITIEDPIEYVYNNDKCVITQREVGSDTQTFAAALRHVLRQDPDVILVGEMRDLETAATALTVAETGHLVLTTGHAPSASQTIERITDLFPPDERQLTQTRLASLLVGVMCQTLVPKMDGEGRVAAIEILLANGAIRNTIREGKVYQLPNIMRTNTRSGMQLLDQALLKLYDDGQISYESVLAFCNDRDQIEKLNGKNNADNSAAILSFQDYRK